MVANLSGSWKTRSVKNWEAFFERNGGISRRELGELQAKRRAAYLPVVRPAERRKHAEPEPVVVEREKRAAGELKYKCPRCNAPKFGWVCKACGARRRPM